MCDRACSSCDSELDPPIDVRRGIWLVLAGLVVPPIVISLMTGKEGSELTTLGPLSVYSVFLVGPAIWLAYRAWTGRFWASVGLTLIVAVVLGSVLLALAGKVSAPITMRTQMAQIQVVLLVSSQVLLYRSAAREFFGRG